MKTKKLNKNVPDNVLEILENCGMKKKYYGKNTLLVRHGSYIYNVTEYPIIYTNYSE